MTEYTRIVADFSKNDKEGLEILKQAKEILKELRVSQSDFFRKCAKLLVNGKLKKYFN